MLVLTREGRLDSLEIQVEVSPEVFSDDRGRFRIRGLPGEPRVAELVIHAKGRARTVSLPGPTSEDGEHVIRISVLED